MNCRTTQRRERLDAHVFVCTTDRSGEHACCGQAGAEAVVKAVEAWLREREAFWTSVAVVETACLGLCSEDGAALTIQPHDEWYADVQPADVPELLSSVLGDV